MGEKGYGHALYYPYIHIQNDDWIKVAALYYDGLTRIVPSTYTPRDSEIVKGLNDECNFIRNYDPGDEAIIIALDFLDLAKRELSDDSRRKALYNRVRTTLPVGSEFLIHEQKIADLVKDALPELGIAKVRNNEGTWYSFDPVAGSLYMASLANKVAENKSLPIVTDTPVYQPIVRLLQQDTSTLFSQIDTGHALASLVIETHVPRDIASVDVKQIVRFRNNHESERIRFYKEIQEIVEKIPEINDQESLQKCLDHHKVRIDDAVDGVRTSLVESGIQCVTGLLGLSVPSWASQLSQILPDLGAQLVVGGLMCMGASVLLKSGMNYYKSRTGSPWSYVLSLERGLNSNTLLNRLLSKI